MLDSNRIKLYLCIFRYLYSGKRNWPYLYYDGYLAENELKKTMKSTDYDDP